MSDIVCDGEKSRNFGGKELVIYRNSTELFFRCFVPLIQSRQQFREFSEFARGQGPQLSLMTSSFSLASTWSAPIFADGGVILEPTGRDL